VAIPLTSESARPPAALIDGDQMSIVELLERDPRLVALVREAEDAELAAGGGRKGKAGRVPLRRLRLRHRRLRATSELPDVSRGALGAC
jgi:hypothetical protein